MQRPIWRLGAALAVAVGIVAACGGGEKPPTEEAELFITATPRQINDRGQASQLSITATTADGAQGTGTVTLKVTAGALGNSTTEETLTLSAGKASTSFTCDKFADAKCAGNVRIDGTWNQATASTTVTVGAGTGTDGGTDGGVIPNPDGGTGTGDGGVKVSVASNKPTIITNVGDVADITATLTESNNSPKAGELITFDTTLGGLQVTTETPAASVQATTDGAGKAVVKFVESGTSGTASIRARHTASGAQATVSVKVTSIQQITHQSTTCGGSACTIMGVRGSGFNEQAQVTFKVVDSSGQAASGVSVTFSIPNAPSGTTVSPSGTTNAQGVVTATVSAGPVIGAIVVHAVAVPNQVQVDSPNIGIRGAKASNQGFSLYCDLKNIAAHISPAPPRAFSVPCHVRVVDRYNNPVGTGTTVNFKVEAGNIPNSVVTKAYSTTGNNDDEGTGNVNFSTTGGTPFPLNVDPLEADANQYPFAREQEPRGTVGQIVRNPRDNLLTIIAYLRGEEFFSDTNSNGSWDSGEQFIDQGEPLVDSNDNGIWDQGETYIDEAPADGKWNGPNGRWDNDTSIWTAAYILYTSYPIDANSFLVPNPFSGPCGSGVAKGDSVPVKMYFADEWFNRPQAANTTFSTSHKASKGTLTVRNAFQDDYGFGVSRVLLNAANNGECVPSAPICIWRTNFYKWDLGYVNIVDVKGAAVSDTRPCEADTITLTTTTLGTSARATADGAIE